MKKTLLQVITATALAVAVLPSFAFGAYEGYTAYVLPAFGGNNYTPIHSKATGDDFINNKVTSFTGTSRAIFWATDRDKGVISGDYDQTAGNTSKIVFTTDVKAGYEVRLGMENYNTSSSSAYVSGQVDFR